MMIQEGDRVINLKSSSKKPVAIEKHVKKIMAAMSLPPVESKAPLFHRATTKKDKNPLKHTSRGSPVSVRASKGAPPTSPWSSYNEQVDLKSARESQRGPPAPSRTAAAYNQPVVAVVTVGRATYRCDPFYCSGFSFKWA